MKKFFIAVLIVGCTTTALAQLPITKTLEWDPNPASDQVTKYVAVINGVSIEVPGSTTSVQFPVNSVGALDISLYACNLWGCGPTTDLHYNVTVPGKSTNVRIR